MVKEMKSLLKLYVCSNFIFAISTAQNIKKAGESNWNSFNFQLHMDLLWNFGKVTKHL